jgi:type II secretion system protein N
VALKISELSVGDGKAKIMNAIALPQLNVGELALEGESTEGNMTISKFAATGRDLELSSDGRLRLRDPFSASLTDLNLRFKFSPSFRNKNDTTRALFGSPGSTMPAMFDLDPRVRAAKRPDEFYAFHLSGAIAQLNFNPAGGGSPGGGALGGSMGGMPMPGGFPPSE